MMAFVNHKMTVSADQVGRFALAYDALDQRNVDLPARLALPTTDDANAARFDG